LEDGDDLQFTWDSVKALANIKKHGVSFEVATFVFDGPVRLEDDDVFAQGEYRTVIVGKVGNLMLTVVHSTPEENLYRIISARLATAAERRAYEQHLFHP
jgi:uncharacterized protein